MRTLQRRFPLIRRYVLGVLIAVPLLFAQGAQTQAALVQHDGFGATGATGLSVDSVTFDITIVGSVFYDDAFPTGDLFLNAATIVDAFVLELNAFSVDPPVISLGPGGFSLGFLIPIAFGGDGSLDVAVGQCPGVDVPSPGVFLCTGPYVNLGVFTFAAPVGGVWAVPSPSPVPLPAALPLFLSALAGLGLMGWRRKRETA